MVEALVKDFTGRRGLRQEWEQIADETRGEIEHTWYMKTLDIVRSVLGESKS